MARITFIGTGIMGAPMAGRLIEAGHSVLAVDHSARDRLTRLHERGAEIAASAREAVATSDVVVTMLQDSPNVAEAAFHAETGFAAAARPGTLWIDCSSIAPDAARELAERAARGGIRTVDAPVSGGEPGAVAGTLSIMVGGAPEDVADARPLLEVLGATVVHVGPAGAGQTVKCANQLIVAGTIELLAEALVFLRAHGADLEAAVSVLGGGLAGSAVLDQKAPKMLARDFAPGFRIDLHHKDLGNFLRAARQAGVPAPVGSLVAELVSAVRAQGDGSLDHSALLRGVERLGGVAPEPA